MAGWIDRAEQLTYSGEEITESVAVGERGLVVTTHRVLVFSPDGDGEAFSDVELPNVTGLIEDERGERRFLMFAAQAGILGAVLLAAGFLIPIESMIGDVSFGEGAGRLGIGGFIGVIEGLIGLLRSLDTILLVLGALCLLGAAGAMGWYLQTRDRMLVIERAGNDPLTIPLGEDRVARATLQRLRRAIDPDGAAPPQA